MGAGRVLLLTDASSDAHAVSGHPERPERRAAAVAGFRLGAGDRLEEASVAPIDDVELSATHDPAYLEALGRMDAAGGGWLDADTFVVPGSLRAARLAAGATVQAGVDATDGSAEVAFAAVRPPGHHAGRTRGRGFCLLNNVAVAVTGLRSRGLAERIAIIDWDVHHGDGTQSIFDADPGLCYASTHQGDFYPGTGSAAETGEGAGRGTMHNRPLAAGTADAGFIAAWGELLVAVEAFRPDALLVSAGYDAHVDDPLAGLAVTEDGFESVARLVGGLSARLGLAGVAMTLEGGYHLDAVRDSVAASIRGLLDGRARTGP
ncbi:MAG: histone deacetylase family protein [Candidatus Limnocylindria bacterium]